MTLPEHTAQGHWHPRSYLKRQPVASHQEIKFMSEITKRELVIGFAAMVMLLLFFGSGTP